MTVGPIADIIADILIDSKARLLPLVSVVADILNDSKARLVPDWRRFLSLLDRSVNLVNRANYRIGPENGQFILPS